MVLMCQLPQLSPGCQAGLCFQWIQQSLVDLMGLCLQLHHFVPADLLNPEDP